MKGGRPARPHVIDRIDPSSKPHFPVSIRTTKHRGGSARPIDIVDVKSTASGAIRTNLEPKLRDGRAVQLLDLPLEMFGYTRSYGERRSALIMKLVMTTVVRNERDDPNRCRIFDASDEPAFNDISWVERRAGHQRVVTA